MKIGDFPIVEALVDRRNCLTDQLEGRVSVSINGRPQDAEMGDAARGAVLAEVRRRIGEVDAELRKHGVQVG